MCRLLGVVAGAPVGFRFSLRDAPRSLGVLSPQHPHGWGVATFCARAGWRVDRNIVCAGQDPAFAAWSDQSGAMLLAHIRFGTVGSVAMQNTHPFRRGRWVFAHNGTLTDLGWLRAQVSDARRAQIEGETDSELLFSYLLSRLDDASRGDHPCDARTDAVIHDAITHARSRPTFGACNFLLSDGATLYAHRWGRTLHATVDDRGDGLCSMRTDADGVGVVMVASEPLHETGWREVPEGTLLRIDGGATPRCRRVHGAAETV